MTWYLLVVLLVRSSLLLAAAEVLRAFCGQCAPKVRFRIRICSVALLAAIPLFSAFLPELHIPLWHGAGGRGVVTVSQTLFVIGHGGKSFSVNWALVVWVAGVLVGLAPACFGAFSVWRIRRQALVLHSHAWTDLLDELCEKVGLETKTEVLKANGVMAPVTCGLARTRILLPADCEGWPDSRRRAVLLHELAHIRRRDLPIQLFVHVIAALWWFQPLAWVVRRGLRHESELACDAEAIALGMRPSQYANELLEIARSLGADRSWASAALSMTPALGLERRIAVILNSQPVSRSSGRAAVSIIGLALVALMASAVTLGANQRFSESRGLTMKRTLIPGLLTSIGLSAATVSGSLTDITGSAIPDAKISLYNPDTGAKQEAVSGADGKFTVENAPAGDAILRVEKPGFSSLFREFDLKTDSNVDRALIMQVGPIQQQVTVAG
ncbi:MAG: M56 family metallopeptidase [Bryobacteraceae bacterium]